jgi:hypothetical protein
MGEQTTVLGDGGGEIADPAPEVRAIERWRGDAAVAIGPHDAGRPEAGLDQRRNSGTSNSSSSPSSPKSS